MVAQTHPLFGVSRLFDRLFDAADKPSVYSRMREAQPPVNVSEDADNLYVSLEIPGVSASDVEIVFSEGALTVKGERKAPEGRYFRQERPSGHFQRVTTINRPIDPDGVKASYRLGILTVVLPKSAEAKPRTITIE